MSEDTTALTGTEIAEAGLEGWRRILDRLLVRYETGDFTTGVALISKIAEAADAANHHPDVDLRYPHVTVSLKSHDVNAITHRDLRLAREITALAEAAGVSAGAYAPDVVEFALDTPAREEVLPFWSAVLGYDVAADGEEIRDPAGRLPTVWFQGTESTASDRQRWHVDVTVPHDDVARRIDAALAAGGSMVSEEQAPAFWVLADADGNQACLCTWQSRD